MYPAVSLRCFIPGFTFHGVTISTYLNLSFIQSSDFWNKTKKSNMLQIIYLDEDNNAIIPGMASRKS